jgi:hypothetical protein
MLSASQIKADPIIFFGASGEAMDSGVINTPPRPLSIEDDGTVSMELGLGWHSRTDESTVKIGCDSFKVLRANGEPFFECAFFSLVRRID